MLETLIPSILLLLSDPVSPPNLEDTEHELRQTLNQAADLAPFTLILDTASGYRFEHSVGLYSSETNTESASTSKLVTAAVVLWFVDQNLISLDDHPQDHLDFWPHTGSHSEITLAQLLSFTSGLLEEPDCIDNPFTTLAQCVPQILDVNPTTPTAGSQFFYGSQHMQLAGAMLIEALALPDWQSVFTRFQTESGYFLKSEYAKPSRNNPRLAGGMIWTANDYMAFLNDLYQGRILSESSLAALLSDHITDAEIVYSPSRLSYGEDWHYGLGIWLECAHNPFDCEAPFRYSSPGAFGSYPFIDQHQNYAGLLAREHKQSGASKASVEFIRVLTPLIETWGRLAN